MGLTPLPHALDGFLCIWPYASTSYKTAVIIPYPTLAPPLHSQAPHRSQAPSPQILSCSLLACSVLFRSPRIVLPSSSSRNSYPRSSCIFLTLRFLSPSERSPLLTVYACWAVGGVRFLGHDAYSACKHCASGYVLSFSFVYILTISLYFSCIYIPHASLYMYTIHAPHELAR